MMADKTTTTMGPPRMTFHGVRVHLALEQPKTKLRKRYLHVSIQQIAPKQWRHHHNLITPYGLDITFVDTSETPDEVKARRAAQLLRQAQDELRSQGERQRRRKREL